MTNPISQAARDAAADYSKWYTAHAMELLGVDCEAKLANAFEAYGAKIREDERKAVVEWLRVLGNATLTPSILAFFGDPWGDDGQRLCLELADAISRAGHLPKEQGNEG